ncbi:hypothetical protein CBR_g19680 [Chara braunii]|uniref:Uncharacterized protein n=1 Tax=Chara braunii TaxID=69332 RepID=A0A388KYM6_CHABU|nr:hypothetical protein CBR_g19680 [Chara braunii]|eukprot:GBG75167.1 hypothetical protein CBR_g19680 [Chara braunii]
MLRDAQRVDEAERIGISLDTTNVEVSKKLNKNKKLVKRGRRNMTRSLPPKPSSHRLSLLLGVLGPNVNKAGTFPSPVTHYGLLENRVNEVTASAKFELKGVLCMGVAAGNLAVDEKEIFQNGQLDVNVLVSLLKKN